MFRKRIQLGMIHVAVAFGAWGMANAVSRLIGSVLGDVVRDILTRFAQDPLAGYMVVFTIETAFLLLSLIMLRSINVEKFQEKMDESPTLIERAAMAGDAS